MLRHLFSLTYIWHFHLRAPIIFIILFIYLLIYFLNSWVTNMIFFLLIENCCGLIA